MGFEAMHQIIYVSEATDSLSPAEIFTIIEQSARNNPHSDITGFLIYRAGTFLQLVEGPLAGLEALLERLRRDPRHRDLRILSEVRIAKRNFPRWRMKRIGEHGDGYAELQQELVAEGSGASLPEPVARFLDRPAA
jgi:hypothetical protein